MIYVAVACLVIIALSTDLGALIAIGALCVAVVVLFLGLVVAALGFLGFALQDAGQAAPVVIGGIIVVICICLAERGDKSVTPKPLEPSPDLPATPREGLGPWDREDTY